jgi:hypothetical protein
LERADVTSERTRGLDSQQHRWLTGESTAVSFSMDALHPGTQLRTSHFVRDVTGSTRPASPTRSVAGTEKPSLAAGLLRLSTQNLVAPDATVNAPLDAGA